MYRLENWSVGDKGKNPYMAPELRKKYLNGEVYDNHNFKDGTNITTSSIKNVDLELESAIVTTSSGSKYRLGKPSEEYLKWLKDNNITFNPNNPIKII